MSTTPTHALEKELAESDNQTRIDEIVNSVPAAIVKAEDDSLSSSARDEIAIGKMSADELHSEIIQTYVALAENVIMYEALVLSARERMHRGEKVGGCLTWTEYADKYLRRDGESLPTCLRRLARAIEGHNPDTKHDGSKGRKSSNDVAENNRRIAAKKIKSALDIPSKEPLPRELEEAWRKGHEKGYDEGYTNGQEALVECLPSVEPQHSSDGTGARHANEAKALDLPPPAEEKSAVRWKADEDEEEERDDLPAYTVTLHAKSIASMKAQLRKLGIEASVEKITRAEGRADRLAEAEREVEDAKATVEELRDELQNWIDNLPENLQGGNKASELEDAIYALDALVGELDNIDFGGVQFPGMY